MYSWPVLLVMFAGALRQSLRFPHTAYDDASLALPLASPPDHPRAIWIIFDELSQTIAFGNRPPGLELPNLDRFREESFYATNATSPANLTEISIPSLILGEKVLRAFAEKPDDLRLQLSSRPDAVSWKSLPNVFDSARALGLNTALVGWFHPYGRILNHSLTESYWTPGWLAPGSEEPVTPRPLIEAMWDRIGLQLITLPLAGHLPGVYSQKFSARAKLQSYVSMNERACEMSADPSIGLAFLHLPIPHPPAIYDRAHGVFTTQKGSYLDNVALVDREFGILRQAMEQSGVWERTAVLVSADHGWRPFAWRGTAVWTPEDESFSHQDVIGVPFLLKLPNQTSGSTYSKPFNTIITRRLITGILQRQITDGAGVAALIEGADGR